ncbi:MAG: HAMP domain-containing histidine kinase [Alphaproteobacteria bacterium]|nr:HAMP domain-containing histidine kinase [Alphaproteobacteria bacterium]
MKSLRRAILFWMALLLFGVGTLSALVTYEYVKDEAQTSFDIEIRQIAQFLQNETVANPSPVQFGMPDPDNIFLIQVWNAQGQLVRTTDKTASAAAPNEQGYSSPNLGLVSWRSYSLIGPSQTIRVSLPLDERNEQASTAALQIAIPIAFIIPLSWLLLSLLIDRILRSLDRAAEQVTTGGAGNRSPIAPSSVPSEIMPFVESINAYVVQVQAQAEKHKRFVSDAAHELRTPLTALSIQISNLKSVLTTKEQRTRLAALEGGSKRAAHLVNRLLQLARHDANLTPANLKSKRLSILLANGVAAIEPQAQQKKIKLQVGFSSKIDPLLPADDLSQICEILLDNAIRYSPAHSTVHMAANVTSESFEIKVLDGGPGIAPDKLPLVFDRFYRAEPHTSPGTGLGLSIAKSICERHGWAISLNNRNAFPGLEAIISGKTAMT